MMNIVQFLRTEVAGGLILLFAAALAMLMANSPLAESYEHFWHMELFTHVTPHFLINEVLMTIFFLMVGLEIRREMNEGVLSSFRTALLPVIAACGGIIAPALIYLTFNNEPATHHGWAIPTATDIAFAVGVLALLGNRVPPALRILLLAIAIADDIAAVLIIALFYADGVAVEGLALAAAGLLVLFLARKRSTQLLVTAYAIATALSWIGLLKAGLHPALAGVALGLMTPPAPAERIEAAILPWVALGVMPLFALANAGVSLGGLDFGNSTSLTLMTGIALALIAGKPLGITAAAALAVSFKICTLPRGITWKGIFVIGCLGGIGFTMSIFIAALTFTGPELAAAKFGILTGSSLAALTGLLLGLIFMPRRY